MTGLANIRELQNVIDRSVILNSSEVLSVEEFRLSQQAARMKTPPALKSRAKGKSNSEKEIIAAALAESRGRVSGPSGAAARLGVSPSTLENRIKALKIDKRRLKYD